MLGARRAGVIGMNGVVKRRANEIVHGRVHDHKRLAAIALGVEHARQQHAGGRNDATAQARASRWQPSGRTMAATARA